MRVRSDILRTYQGLHSWMGIACGLFLYICFLAGSLTMFKSSIQAWVDAPGPILPSIEVNQFDRLIAQAIEYGGIHQGFSLSFEQDPAPLSWTEPNQMEDSTGADGTRWHASLDKQGLLVTESSSVRQLADFIDELHETAGIPGHIGHTPLGLYFMGIIAVIYFLALISGLIFLLPKLVSSFFALRQQKGKYRFWLDLHNLLGVTSLPFHAVMAFTVVVFAFHDQFYDGLGLVYADQPLFDRPVNNNREYSLAELPPIQSYLDLVTEQYPEHRLNEIHFQGLDGQRPVALLDMVTERHLQISHSGDRLFVHPYSLDILYSTHPPGEEGIWGRLASSFFALHFGSYGGDWIRWMYFLLGLSGALLFYTGNRLWLIKRRQYQKQSTRSLNILSSLTVGVSLGCIAGIAVAMMAARLFPGSNWLFVAAYYIAFLGSVGFAFVRREARAVTELLLANGLLLLLVPLASFLRWPWEQQSMPVYWVNLLTLLAGLMFIVLARFSASKKATDQE